MKIKIGRHIVEIKKDDRITFDGEKYTLLSGKIRPLIVVDNEHFCWVDLPKTVFNKIPKDSLRKKRNCKIDTWEVK